jgi:hypothetical protein
MVESDKIYETKLKHEGLFDFKDLYKFVYEWFNSYQYTVAEKKYEEKVVPTGKDIEVEWECLRKISDYFRFKVKITYRLLGIVSVEVQRGNVKIKMNKGQVEVKAAGFLEKDYENRWEHNPVAKFLRGVYDRYIIRNRIEWYEDKLAAEVDEAIAQVKAFLALEARR